MELPDFLDRWPNGEVVLKGHRIVLYSIIDRLREGQGPGAIHDEFPSLNPAVIQGLIEFYGAHRAELDAYAADYRADLEKQAAASRPGPGVRRVRRRMAERATSWQPKRHG